MEFEWDDAKAARNLRDHGVGFAQAVATCRDPFAVEWIVRGCPKRSMPTHILAFPEEVRDGETVWNGHERCGVGSG
jgi:hypothetical protein